MHRSTIKPRLRFRYALGVAAITALSSQACGSGGEPPSTTTSSDTGSSTGSGGTGVATGSGGTGGSTGMTTGSGGAGTSTGSGGTGMTGSTTGSGGTGMTGSTTGSGGTGTTGSTTGSGGTGSTLCSPAATMPCYTGPAGTMGLGLCVAGVTTCDADGAAWGPCVGEVTPKPESCNTAQDDNCDGQVNEGCACTPGSLSSCYSGPAGTEGVGVCHAGTATCNAQGTGYGPCVGEVTPQPESCAATLDENCNGQVNEGCATCLWSRAWGSAQDEESWSVATDASGNVFIGGYINATVDFGCGALAANTTTFDSATIVKLSPSGACLWNRAAGGAFAHVQSMAVDASGNVYATGFFEGTIDFGCGPLVVNGAPPDTFAVKLSAGGACLWSKRYGSAQFQSGTGIAVDSAGNVLLTGYVSGNVDFSENGTAILTSHGSFDVYLAKLDTNGNHLWSKRFGETMNQQGSAVAVDAMNNVLLLGQFLGSIDLGGGQLTSAGLNDVFIAKFDSGGNHVWSKAYGDSADQTGASIAVDAAGNVIAAGGFGGSVSFGGGALASQGGTDAWLLKLGPTGNHLWSKVLGGPNAQSAAGVAVDAAGNIAVTGPIVGTADFGGGMLAAAGGGDVFVAKYDPAGAHVWSRVFGDAGAQIPQSIAFDPSGNLYGTGLLTSPLDVGCGPVTVAGGEDSFLFKLSP